MKLLLPAAEDRSYIRPQVPGRPLYIGDLDGTVCNVEHRKHLVQQEKFEEFNRACVRDTPNQTVVLALHLLATAGADIWLFSGRDDYMERETREWLVHYCVPCKWLQMRPSGDRTEDHELKEQWLHRMLDVDRRRLVGVFDDRQTVVDMWRRNGVRCFQVAPGNF